MGTSKKFWNEKKVLVTGGHGFLGSHLIDRLSQTGCELVAPRRSEYDLTKEEEVKRLFRENPKISLLIHLAVDGGGIGYLREKPGSSFYNNIMMGVLLQEQSRINGIEKFVGVGSICEYPKITPVPFKEENLWEGYPEETNAPYGLAKKMMLVQGQGYRDQFGFNSIHLMPVNLYGPRDDFDLKASHVVPALIRKMIEAKEKSSTSVEIWGTGNASRELLYVEDCAEAILLASEKYNGRDPVNLGSGIELPMREIVAKIKALTGFEGEIKFDTSKPDGQPRRCLDVSRAEREFGFKAKTSLEDGLKKTIDWYQKQKK
jgi:GDP-L-fucose synthase